MAKSSSIKRVWLGLVYLVAAGLVLPNIVQANGGTSVYNEESGPFQVSILGSPTPPQPEQPFHLSIYITKHDTGARVTDALVIIDPSLTSGNISTNKVRAQAGGAPNIYDVDIPVPQEGVWKFSIDIQSQQYGKTTVQINNIKVEKPGLAWYLLIIVLAGFPLVAAAVWFFLFRKQNLDDDDDDDGNTPSSLFDDSGKSAPKQTAPTNTKKSKPASKGV